MGSDSRTMMTVRREAWTPEIEEAWEIADSEGLEFVPMIGTMQVYNAKGKLIKVNAAIENGKIYAKADSLTQSIREAVLHEVFHEKAQRDPKMVERVIQKIKETYSKAQIQDMLERYYDLYQNAYGGRLTDEELELLIWEEMLADAYAEFQRYKDVFGTAEWAETVQDAVWSGSSAETEAEDGSARFSVDSEESARDRAERELTKGIAEIMSVPQSQIRELREGPVRDFMEAYQETGEVNQDLVDAIVSEAFAKGLIVDNEYYERYKPVKDYLRTTALTISEQDRADIPDFSQFRKKAFGTLKIVNTNGLPVDSAWLELMDMAPELFRKEVTHPADQLMRMYDVGKSIKKVQKSLERAMGDQADEFYDWAETRMTKLVDRVLEKYAERVKWTPGKTQAKTQQREVVEYPVRKPDTYDRANERMFRAGQEVMEGWNKEYPIREPDTYDRANERMFRAGQEVMEGWNKEYPVREPDTYDRANERMFRAGQEVMEGWVRPNMEPEFASYEQIDSAPDESGQGLLGEFRPREEPMTDREKALRGSMRDWIKYVLGGGMTPTEFAESMRKSQSRELRGRALEIAKSLENTSRNGELYRDPDMSEEEWEALNQQWKNRQEISKSRGEMTAVENLAIPKERFTSTPAMEKLGIKVDGSVTRYRQTDQLRAYDKAAKQAERVLLKRVKDLKPSQMEKNLARSLAEGTITASALNEKNLNVDVIVELAEYMMAARSFREDMIAQRKSEINTSNWRIADNLFKDSEDYKPKLKLAGLTKMIMNERTPERVVKQIFGKEQGQKIYETYFRPVWVNGAEMNRFENRMLKRVEKFTDQNGATRKLTVEERAMTQRLLEGQAALERVERLDRDMQIRVTAAASNVNNGGSYSNAIKEFHLDGEENEYYQGLVQAYADYLDTVTASKDMDQIIMENAIEEYKKIYNELFDAINDFLVSHGYNEIGFIRGYAPHFQKREVQQGLIGALKALGVEKESVSELPADIAGRTADFKPNMRWNPHMQGRKGSATSYDIQMGFEQYLHYAAEMFYHTDDVMRIRQAVKWFRGQYSGDTISEAIEKAQIDKHKTVEWKQDFLEKKGMITTGAVLDSKEINAIYNQYLEELFEKASPENLQKYSEFVTWLDNYANIVAGKQSLADRGLEYGGGRDILNVGSRLMRAFSAANVAGNLSSVLNQSAQLPLIQQQLGSYLERAMFDMARGGTAKDHFAERSDFLTDKRGVEKLTVDGYEAFISSLFKPAEMMDRLVSTLAVRGKYLQALDQGMDMDEAMKEADDFGRRVMGSRMKGAKPLGFESKTFVNQMLHVFQVEAANTFDYMLVSDMPQEIREIKETKGRKAASRYLAGYVMGYLMNAFLLNQLTDKLYGGSPAPFDLIGWGLNFVAGGFGVTDDEFMKTLIDNIWERLFGERIFDTEPLEREDAVHWAGAAENVWYDVLNDVPYVRNAMGLMGLGDQTLPTVGINELLEYLESAGGTLAKQVFQGEEETGLSWAGAARSIGEDLVNAATMLLPGGRQLKKTLQGIATVAQGGRYYGDRMQYPVEQNLWNAIQAGLFGPSALAEADAYYAAEYSSLTAGQTKKVEELEDLGISRFVTYELYQEFREIGKNLTGAEASEAKRNAINNLPLTDQEKLEVYSTFILDRASEKYEENRAEFQAMLDAGLTWEQVTEAHNVYAALNDDEEMRATEKATEFAKWVDMQDMDEDQKATVEEKFKFYNMMPAAAANYEKFEQAGVAPEKAAGLAQIVAGLEPEDGRNYVTDAQKILAIDGSDLTEEEKVAAISAMVPDRREKLVAAGVEDATARKMAAELAVAEAQNGDEDLDYLQKARILADLSDSDDEALAAVSTVLQEGTYTKVELAAEYGVPVRVWLDFKEEWLDVYGEDSVSQDKVKTVLDRMHLTGRQKAVLWQIANKSWKPKNNPYDVYVGEEVYDDLNP